MTNAELATSQVAVIACPSGCPVPSYGSEIEAHCLADPASHPDVFSDDDTVNPDSSRPYFLDLIGRINEAVE